MNNENGNKKENKAWVKFDKEIKIGKKKVPVAKYKGVFFIPKEKNFVPQKNNLYLVFLPIGRYPFYVDGKSIYSVKIIEPEIIEGMKVFKNVFISDNLFRSAKNDREKIRVIIRSPDEKGEHKTSLLRIVMADNGNLEAARFIKKNLLIENIWIKKNGIIEAIVEPLEDSNYLKNGFLRELSNSISKNIRELKL